MTPSVTVLTEREHVVQQWRQALTKHGIESKVVAPSGLANAVKGQVAVIVDGRPAHCPSLTSIVIAMHSKTSSPSSVTAWSRVETKTSRKSQRPLPDVPIGGAIFVLSS